MNSAINLLLKTLGYGVALKEVLSSMTFDEIFTKGICATSPKLEEFVEEKGNLLLRMITSRNMAYEDLEGLTDALMLFKHVEERLESHTNGNQDHGMQEFIIEDDFDDSGKQRIQTCESCKHFWHTIGTKNKPIPRVNGESAGDD